MVAFEKAIYTGSIGPKEVAAAWAIAAVLVLGMIGGAELLGHTDRDDRVPAATQAFGKPAKPSGASVHTRDGRTLCSWPRCQTLRMPQGIDI